MVVQTDEEGYVEHGPLLRSEGWVWRLLQRNHRDRLADGVTGFHPHLPASVNRQAVSRNTGESRAARRVKCRLRLPITVREESAPKSPRRAALGDLYHLAGRPRNDDK